MTNQTGWRARFAPTLWPKLRHAMAQGPWGGGPDGGKGSDGDSGSGAGGGGPRNPWSRPSGGGGGGGNNGGGGRSPERGPSAIEELLRRSRESWRGMPQAPGGKPLWLIAIGIVLILWLALTCFHRIGPKERGIVTQLGKYSRILTPGISMTLPAPLESVDVIDVEEINTIDIGSAGNDPDGMMLTGDQNIIDLAYSVRWNIRDPQLYRFQLADPDKTIDEVARSTMRAVVASVSLDDALGVGRNSIEQQVAQRMQQILDAYRSGVRIQGIAIKQADPPAAVNDAFKEVSAAQQTAQTYLNQARNYSQQLTARAQGEAAAFDKVYVQYKLSPEVTRRRMYYETMEQVLAGIDKTIVETGGVQTYLPLPEIQRRARPTPPVTPTPAEGAQP